MFHKVNNVETLPNYELSVQFAEGITKKYDLKPLFKKWKQFAALKNNEELYESVKVDQGGFGISWNDELDLSCNELFDNGTVVKTPFDGLISFGDATLFWELNESTLRKAVSYGKFLKGIDVCKFGKQWVVSMDAMRREYGERKK
ncbi:MAG TPA: DUF2442 domain-containing protein [Eubacterium sp.]|nr:DUF2442 domain-containing protein [Eubacterium sp.]